MPSSPTKKLERFENPNPERDYYIECRTSEFTCLCPKTGQPDFAEIEIKYIPDKFCVELKSLKLYLWSFRNEGAFHEAVTNKIMSDLVMSIEPRFIQVKAKFLIRGGIETTILCEHGTQKI